MTFQNNPMGQPWYPQPAPRLVNRGIQGGTFTIDQLDGQWKSVLKLESKNPDDPTAESNDHFRTIYCQTTPGSLSTIGENFVTLGLLLRFRFGIGNGQMHTYYDVPPNGILRAAVTGQSVEVDAATVQIYFDGAFGTQITQETVDNPIPIRAFVPPTLTIGVIQNEALGGATPKRMLNVTTPGAIGVPRRVFIPPGAQSVRIVGDPAALHAAQIFDPTESVGLDIPINVETPLVAGTWLITLDSVPLGAGSVASVVFGLGI